MYTLRLFSNRSLEYVASIQVTGMAMHQHEQWVNILLHNQKLFKWNPSDYYQNRTLPLKFDCKFIPYRDKFIHIIQKDL